MDVKQLMPNNGCQTMDANKWMPKDGCQQMDANKWMPTNGCGDVEKTMFQTNYFQQQIVEEPWDLAS